MASPILIPFSPLSHLRTNKIDYQFPINQRRSVSSHNRCNLCLQSFVPSSNNCANIKSTRTIGTFPAFLFSSTSTFLTSSTGSFEPPSCIGSVLFLILDHSSNCGPSSCLLSCLSSCLSSCSWSCCSLSCSSSCLFGCSSSCSLNCLSSFAVSSYPPSFIGLILFSPTAATSSSSTKGSADAATIQAL
ncbi:hypothetical protein BGX38DRAFT_210958 [Terfezia claveryi]|nr:hypothetical protein BGX38DRAFT_210958 [Terfezia claveryi]